mmetsp:Transcript_9525/g.38923  ORF Transcript_9525/g.38923 Transcript_9525/m.38923 type:complete len:227 (+) Transcript_9525:1924-2604(+)
MRAPSTHSLPLVRRTVSGPLDVVQGPPTLHTVCRSHVHGRPHRRTGRQARREYPPGEQHGFGGAHRPQLPLLEGPDLRVARAGALPPHSTHGGRLWSDCVRGRIPPGVRAVPCAPPQQQRHTPLCAGAARLRPSRRSLGQGRLQCREVDAREAELHFQPPSGTGGRRYAHLRRWARAEAHRRLHQRQQPRLHVCRLDPLAVKKGLATKGDGWRRENRRKREEWIEG